MFVIRGQTFFISFMAKCNSSVLVLYELAVTMVTKHFFFSTAVSKAVLSRRIDLPLTVSYVLKAVRMYSFNSVADC